MSDDDPPVGRVFGDESATVRAAYDYDSISPFIAVIKTVAAATGREPTRLESLYDRIDPDALDTLFRRPAETPTPNDVQLSFPYEGHDVTVQSDGLIEVQLDR